MSNLFREAARTSPVTAEEMMDCYQFGTVPAIATEARRAATVKQGAVEDDGAGRQASPKHSHSPGVR